MKKCLFAVIALFGILHASTVYPLEFEWSALQANAAVPAVITPVQGPAGLSGVRAEVQAPGTYQGIMGVADKAVDLADYRALEFYVRHNISSDKLTMALMLYGAKGMNLCHFYTPTADWHKVQIPLDATVFQPATGNSVIFSTLDSIRVTAFGSMDEKGEFIELAGMRLLPRDAAAHPLNVMKYRHVTKPTSGEAGMTLTDGDREKNVTYRQFSDDPDIIFDLGGRFAIDSIVVYGNSAPSHNFTEMAVLSSYDGKEWTAGGILKNTRSSTVAQVTDYPFTPGKVPVIGRYIRLTASRARTDFPVTISEVTFTGHEPSAEEMRKAADLTYDTGVPMPPRTSTDYVELKNGDWQLWISRRNGVVNGIYYKGKLLVERMTAQYTLQTRKDDTIASGNQDVVKGLSATSDAVTVTLTNPKLPGLEIVRTWKIDKNALLEQVTLRNLQKTERKFLRMATEVILEQTFRKNGFYEMPGTGIAVGMYRLPAKDIQMDKAQTNIPTVAFDNGVTDQVIWHTRYRFNGRFTYMDVGTEEDNLQVFRPNGWLLTSATFVPMDKPEQTYENRFAVTEGGMLKAYDSYQRLPEVAAYRGQVKRPAWLRDIRVSTSMGWEGYRIGGANQQKNFAEAFSPRGALYEPAMNGLDNDWGELRTSGFVRSEFGNRETAEELKAKLADFKAIDPRIKLGFYTWFWSAYYWTKPVQEHPEWFVKTLRNGGKASWYPGVNVNYLRFMGNKESRKQAVDTVVNFINYYEQDGWYVDGGKSGTYAKDWDTMCIDDPLGQTDFYLEVRNRMQSTHPERVVFFNHCENPLGDIGYLEANAHILTNEWRVGAILMWKFKMFSYRDPLHYSVFIYWLPTIDREFKNYLAGIGVLPSFASRSFSMADLPYISARYEIRQAQLADAKVSPDWRYDTNETLELMPLRQGQNGWFFVHDHSDKSSERQVAVKAASLGIDRQDAPVYAWVYTIRNANEWHTLFSDQQVSAAYKHCGWIADRAVTSTYLGTRPWSDLLSQKLQTAPGQAQVVMFSQVPAVILSIENEPSHYYLASQPGLELTERNGEIVAQNDYETAEVGLILPAGKIPERVLLNGTPVDIRVRQDRNFRTAVVPVSKGSSRIVMTMKDETPIQATDLNCKLQGRMLSVTVTPANAPVELYSNDCLVLSRTGSFKIELPDATPDGDYEVHAGHLTRNVTLKNLGRPFKLRPNLPTLQDNVAVVRVGKTIRGIGVLSEGKCYTDKASLASVDVPNLKVKAGTLRCIENHFNNAAAALELEVKRFLKLRLYNNFRYYNLYGYVPKDHVVRPGPQCFGGLMLDFGTPAGYSSRTAAGMGLQSEKRTDTNPSHWGTKAKPNHFYVLNNAILDDQHDTTEIWIDLKELGAPDDWNGRIWFTLFFQNLRADRDFTVEILETTDTLPQNATAQEVHSLDKPQNKTFTLKPFAGSAPDWSTIPVLGSLTPFNPIMTDVQTIAQATYNDDGICFRLDCREKTGRILNCEGGRHGEAWKADGVEFFVEIGGKDDVILHAIVDAEGHTYVEHSPLVLSPNKKIFELEKVPFTYKVTPNPPGWITEIYIPWPVLGGKPAPGKLRAFNLMRTRLEQGQYEHYTISGGNKYISGRRAQFSLEK